MMMIEGEGVPRRWYRQVRTRTFLRHDRRRIAAYERKEKYMGLEKEHAVNPGRE